MRPACPKCGEDKVRNDDVPFVGCAFFCEECLNTYIWEGPTSRPVTADEDRRMGWLDRCPHCKVSIASVVHAQTRIAGRAPCAGEGFFCAFCSGVSVYSPPPPQSPIRRLVLRPLQPEHELQLPPPVREYIELMRMEWREQMGKEN